MRIETDITDEIAVERWEPVQVALGKSGDTSASSFTVALSIQQ